MIRYVRIFSSAAFFSICLVGCGGNKAPAGAAMAKPQLTHGTITFPNGTPLLGGIVTFKPVDVNAGGGKIRYDAAALVDADGRYKLGFNGDGSGAPSGDYVVVIEPRELNELPKSNVSQIPSPYKEKATTPLKATVKDGDNKFDFELK